MAPSRMVPATLAATAIHMLYQHLWPCLTGGQGLFDGLWEDEAFATFWQTQTQAVNVMTPVDDTLTISNGTAAAGTEPPIAALFSAAWFVELLATLAAAVAMYYWSVGLERAFPARPRGVAIAGRGGSGGIAAGGEKTGLLSEDREEEVVKQWIAQGRVRRSSLSWCNTFAKWLLTMTLGVALQAGVREMVETLAKRRLPFAFGGWQIPLAMVFGIADFFFSLGPVALLLSLIFVPAPQRIVFVNAVHLLGMVFFVSAVRTLVPWVIKKDFVQGLVANMTEKLNGDIERTTMLVEKARRLDEL